MPHDGAAREARGWLPAQDVRSLQRRLRPLSLPSPPPMRACPSPTSGRLIRALVAVAAWLAVPSAPLQAQAGDLRGAVRDSASGTPIAGAVVLLLDAAGATIGRTITGARGTYRLSRPEAAELVRTVRLGFRPATERLPSVRAPLMIMNVVMSPVPRGLDAVEVVAAQGCPVRIDRAEAFALLDQARAGLLATIVAREREPAALTILRFERFLDLDGIDVEKQYVRVDSARSATTSFNAVQNAVDFVDRGFRSGRAGQFVYYGPDADVLLDERFQRGYCFSVATADSARVGQIGLHFSAASRRAGRVDIDGTLWIDTVVNALHDITFRYVGVEPLAESFRAGGRVGFRTLPSGVPFIDQWSLRLVGAPDTSQADLIRTSQVYAVREVGGELAEARWPDGQRWTGELGDVHLTAVDGTGAPFGGATLRLLDSDYRVTTDESGRGTIAHVLPGRYTLVADDTALATVALQIPTGRAVTVRRAQSALLRVTVPSAEAHVGTRCRSATPAPTATESWVIARVIGNDGQPAAGAHWRISVADGARWRVVADNGLTGSDGLLMLCRGLARDATVEVAAWRDPKDAVRVRRVLTGDLAVFRVPLPAAVVVANNRAPAGNRATAMVRGTVRDSLTGAVVADARVTLLESPFEGATDSTGVFAIGGVWRGEYVVEVSTPALDSIGAVSRTRFVVDGASSPVALYTPSIPSVMGVSCGAPDIPGAIVGRLAWQGPLPEGMRVVAEWPQVADSAGGAPGVHMAWAEAPVDERGQFRICRVPLGVPLLLRTEAERASTVGAREVRVQLGADRRIARADLVLDSTVVATASLTGEVLTDTVGTPLDNAEVTITDLRRSVTTDRRGRFRLSEIPPGEHLVSIRRVGYAPFITAIAFEPNRAVEQRILLNRAPTLASVSVTADARGDGLPADFDERRRAGMGRFLARAELDRHAGRRLGDVLTQLSGFGAAQGSGSHAWVVGKRAPSNDLREQGVYCPSDAERRQGIPSCACFSQVYLDGRLLNTSRPTEPFDANTLPVDDIAGVEFYATAAGIPGRYSALNAVCGVMLVWTRRR